MAGALEVEVEHRHSTGVAARANHAADHAERRARDVRDNAEAEALRRLDADREAEEQRHNRRRSPGVANAVRASGIRILHQDDLVEVLEHRVSRELRHQLVSERFFPHVAVRDQVLVVPSRLERQPLAVNFRLPCDFLKRLSPPRFFAIAKVSRSWSPLSERWSVRAHSHLRLQRPDLR